MWDFDSSPVASLFYKGLKGAIKDELAHDNIPEQTTALMNLAIAIDNRIITQQNEHKEEEVVYQATTATALPSESSNDKNKPKKKSFRPGGVSANPNTQQTTQSTRSSSNDAVRPTTNVVSSSPAPFRLNRNGKVPPDEMQRHIDNKLCCFCGGQGHTNDNCPVRMERGRSASVPPTVAAAAQTGNE